MRMKPTGAILGIASVFGFILIGGIVALEPRADTPTSVADDSALVFPHEVDLGVVRYGDVVAYSIPVRNNTSSPVTVVEISLDCGCTTVARAPLLIEPGCTVSIEGELETKKDLAAKSSSSAVTLRTDDGSEVRVRLRARMQPPLPEIVSVNEASAALQCHPLYGGVIMAAKCYPGESIESLPSEVDSRRGLVTVHDIPHSAASLQLVLRISPDGDSNNAYELMQEVFLNRHVEEVEGSIHQVER